MFAAIAAAHLEHTKHVLLPNIRELLWTTDDIHSLSHCHTLIGPRLMKLDMHLRNPPDTLIPSALWHELPATMHSIMLFGIDVSDAFCRLKLHNLRVFKCEAPCTTDVLRHLSLLPSLQSLQIVLDGLDFETTLASIDRPIFPALRSLQVTFTDFSACIRFLKFVKHCKIDNLKVETTNPVTANGMSSFIRRLRDTCWQSTLAYLAIFGRAIQGHRELVDADTLQLLSDFRQIRTLAFYTFHMCFEIDDSVADHLARSWPRLSRLAIGSEELAGWTPRLTLRGLTSFAKHCLDLDYLHVDLDAREVVSLNREDVPSRCALKDLNVGSSRISNPTYVAIYLSSIFPRLQCIYPTPRSQSRDYGEWMAIANALRATKKFLT